MVPSEVYKLEVHSCGMKVCYTCKANLECGAFKTDNRAKDKLNYQCRACDKIDNDAKRSPAYVLKLKQLKEVRSRGNKICPLCREKPLSEFGKNSRRLDGKRDWCKDCTNRYERKRCKSPRIKKQKRAKEINYMKTDAGKAKARRAQLKYMYNTTPEVVEQRLKDQNYKCEYCGIHQDDTKQGYLCIHHNHDNETNTDKMDCLLCDDCNVTEGRAKIRGNTQWLRTLADSIDHLKHVTICYK